MPKRKRQRGEIERLPSGALRVKVYAGIDPISKKRLYLTETVAPGERAEKDAENARIRLANQVNEQRNPRTRATVNQLLDRRLQTHDVDPSTRAGNLAYIRKHIRPLLGREPAAKINAELLESFYAELRRCRDHCDGKRFVQHRTDHPHRCDEHESDPCKPARPGSCRACARRCKWHECRGLSDATILKIHWILSGAFDAAVRWHWIDRNPCERAARPSVPKPNPEPPTPAQAALLVAEASRVDVDWGVLVWVAMTTGARRGEICALRWNRLHEDAQLVEIKRAIGKDASGKFVEKDTKTHQQRRVVLDSATLDVLRAHRQRCEARADALGLKLPPDAYIFSSAPDGSTFLSPESVTQRYERLAQKTGVETTLHRLRHYSATELINAGVDVRAVAGRLGHGGGGATTLRVYAAWTSEADQRAAMALADRVPQAPESLLRGGPPDRLDEVGSRQLGVVGADGDQSEQPTPVAEPYLQIASDIRGAIACGAIDVGAELPSLDTLAKRYGVANSTAYRAFELLKNRGWVDVHRGKRAVVSVATVHIGRT